MSDFLLEIARRPAARFVYRKLPVPMDLPPVLERATMPWPADPLKGKTYALGVGPGVSQREGLRALLERAGASTGKASGPAARVDAAVMDATGVRKVAELEPIYRFLHDEVARLAPSGRVVLLGTRSDELDDAEAAAAQEALVGLARSLAKEIGRRGATAHVLFLPSAEAGDMVPPIARASGPLLWLLSSRSAFVSGQVLRLDPEVPPPMGIELPEVAPLRGKRAVVTGAARGIGFEIVRSLAREGASVLGIDHPTQKAALDAAMQSVKGSALALDLADPACAAALEKEITGRWGSVDIVVNNAGITRDKTLAKMPPELWTAVLRVNLEAPLRITRALAGGSLLGAGGRVIVLSSVVGIAGNFGQTNYSAAKAGLLGLVAHESRRLGGRGITVNAIAPGFIDTPMTAKIPFVNREIARRLCSLKQGGLPDDVAQAVTFLASPGAYAVNGAVLRVCGQSLLGA